METSVQNGARRVKQVPAINQGKLQPFNFQLYSSTYLVIGGRDNPRVLVVELHGADVVQVAQKSEQTTPQLVVPHLSRV